MAARIEDGVVVFLSDAVETQRLVELSFGVRVLLEPTRDVGLKAGVLALGIERRASTLGRCEGDLGAGIFEHVVRRGHLLQPEASLTAGVAELVVRGQNHQDFHNALLCLIAFSAFSETTPVTLPPGRQPDQRIARQTTRQETAALRDFDPAYVGSGSKPESASISFR